MMTDDRFTGHTEGPWHCFNSDSKHPKMHQVIFSRGTKSGVVIFKSYVSIQDANLIASAPDLLAIVRELAGVDLERSDNGGWEWPTGAIEDLQTKAQALLAGKE